MKGQSRALLIATGVLALLAMLALGYWWGASRSAPAVAAAPSEPAQRKVLYWYDPMAPDQHFDRPGKSPFMDMMLVPKYAAAGEGEGVAVSPAARQSLGIRTVVVRRGRVAAALRVPGLLSWNLREERIVSVPVDAVIERLYVRTPFEAVRPGQPLLRLRAPMWSAALAESRALSGATSPAARELGALGGQRLRALGLPAGASVEAGGGIVLVAPIEGVLSEIGVREGQSVSAGSSLLRINGSRTLWLEAQLPQSALEGLTAGTPVQVSVDAWPGRSFTGSVEALLPQVDADTRSRRARIVLDNPDGALAPGMFAQVAVHAAIAKEYPLVPTGAVIDDGRQSRVIVLDAHDRFVPVLVQTGRSGDGMIEVRAGLAGGERVVASGQFLIDSEASLSGALQRLEAPAHKPAPRP